MPLPRPVPPPVTRIRLLSRRSGWNIRASSADGERCAGDSRFLALLGMTNYRAMVVRDHRRCESEGAPWTSSGQVLATGGGTPALRASLGRSRVAGYAEAVVGI